MEERATLGLMTREQLLRELQIGDTRERMLRNRTVDPLPHLRFGRQVFFDPSDVRAWLERQTRRTTRARSSRRSGNAAV